MFYKVLIFRLIITEDMLTGPILLLQLCHSAKRHSLDGQILVDTILASLASETTLLDASKSAKDHQYKES